MSKMSDIDLTLKFINAPKGVVYLSVSWQPDKGKDFGYRIINRLDQEDYLVIGDTKGFGNMDMGRIRRIMSQADGFLSVLPFRPEKDCQTSSFMLDELEAAIKIGMPISIKYDSRIPLSKSDAGDAVTFQFSEKRTITIPKSILTAHNGYDYGVSTSEELQLINLHDFLARATTPANKIQPYSFLISRLQPDFNLPRNACIAAAETASGIPCIWIDSSNYRTNIEDTVERARLLIKHAEFVIAEMSLSDENPESDNPSRAHEIGLATAYRKKVYPVSHLPRRPPYHGLVNRQLVWWDNEEQLFQDLYDTIYKERGFIGRHVYNQDLENLEDGYKCKFPPPEFDTKAVPPWTPPVTENAALSYVYTISFAVLAGCISLLLHHCIGYDDTLDFAAIFSAIVVFFFSSRISRKILFALHRPGPFQLLIPFIAFVLLIVTIFVLQSQPGKAP